MRVIKELFGIQVIVNVNIINHVMLEKKYIIKIVNAEKKIVDKLIKECTKNINDVKIARTILAQNENKFKSSCTLYIFNNLYNQHWNPYLFHLLEINKAY